VRTPLAVPLEVEETHEATSTDVHSLLVAAHERFATVESGTVADYIPALASANPELFGLAFVGPDGEILAAGDAERAFSIQSISKAFVFALVCQAIGYDEARAKIGLNSTGFPFNSAMAIELGGGSMTNPMVNAGAIATTSLVPGATADTKWAFIHDGLSRFAGRTLELNVDVYRSEAESNQRNQGIARLLASHKLIYFEPLAATDVYTKQCSVDVTVADLAVMASTLALGGVNPVTGLRVVDADVCARVLAVLATAGLYDHSGEWLCEVGLPAKSGVSGGIIAIAPGTGGLATFSPPVDTAGNSVRGGLAIKFIAEELSLNVFAAS
jgi:glutaminase